MVSSLKHLSTLNCESCQLRKHIHQSFPNSLRQALHPFSLVHFDILGSSRTVTPSGFIFVDKVTFIQLFPLHLFTTRPCFSLTAKMHF